MTWPLYGETFVVTSEFGNDPLDHGCARHALDSPIVGVHRTPTKPFAPVLFVRSTTVLLPLLESLTRLAITAACGRSSICVPNSTIETTVRDLPRSDDGPRT